MSVMANGWGSRERARLALKRMQQAPKYDESAMTSAVGQSDEDVVDAKPVATSSGSPQTGASKRSVIRLTILCTTSNDIGFILKVKEWFLTIQN